jgi:hypothetical protein
MIGLLHFVFGLEMTVNCLRGAPFGRLPAYTPLINVGIALLLYFGVVASSLLVGKSARECFASITFLAASLRLNRELIGTLSAMMPILLAMAAVIAVQLLRTIHVEPCQRVAGTRMVFYLVLAAIQIVSAWLGQIPQTDVQAFILPFFSSTFLSNGETDAPPMSAMMAEYVLYVFGTVIAFLHLFLRANAARTAIKPSEAPWHKRRKFRLFGPNELEIMTISPPLHLMHPDYPADEKRAYELSLPNTPLPALPFPVQTPTYGHARSLSMSKEMPESPDGKSSFRQQTQSTYTLFPGAEDLILPATVYTPPTAVKSPTTAPPPPPQSRRPSYAAAHRTRSSSCVSFNTSVPPPTAAAAVVAQEAQNSGLRPPRPPWVPAHRRGRSDDSSATVQIGLRLSEALAPVGERQTHTPPPPLQQRRYHHHRSHSQPLQQQLGPQPRPPARASDAPRAAADCGDDDLTRALAADEAAFADGGAAAAAALSAALRQQTRGATGRDLNSFRWLDEEAQRAVVSASSSSASGHARRSSDGGGGAGEAQPGGAGRGGGQHAFSLLPGARPRADTPSIYMVEPPRTAPVQESGVGGARWI